MSRAEILRYSLILFLLGTGWGLTQPLSKTAVSTGHGHFGLVFWQLAIGAICLSVVGVVTRRRFPGGARALGFCLFIALIGTVIPNAASYMALVHIPAGVQSVLMSLVPMAAFPIAIALRLEGFSLRRAVGLCCGLAGVLILVLPEASLPDPDAMPWIAVTLIAVRLYAFEGNYVARWGTAGLDAVQVLWGASVIGTVVALPLALGSGQFISPLRPLGAPEWALIGSSVIHACVYTGYVWLVGRAGSVFAAQVGYPVTATGVLWAMLILSETYSPYFWAAAALILSGVFLVQPRRQDALASRAAMRET